MLQIWLSESITQEKISGPPRNSLFLFLLMYLMQKEEEKN